MKPEEKINRVLEVIKEKFDLGIDGMTLEYRAGFMGSKVPQSDEIIILNKLDQEGAIDIVGNFASDYI